MRVRILGCSGGIGVDLRTTSFLVDDDILIDCGTGVGDLAIAEMAKLRHVFVSHSHLDHVVGLPLLIDTLFDRLCEQPLTLHCQPQTFEALEKHIFNWTIWPDFFQLPNKRSPVIRFCPILPGEIHDIDARTVEAIAMNHAVSVVGYRVANNASAVAFSGDTTTTDHFWEVLNSYDMLDLLIIECAFSEQERELSNMAKHYTPLLLAEDMRKLRHRPKTCITHLKPGAEEHIFAEIKRVIPDRDLQRLVGGDVFQL